MRTTVMHAAGDVRIEVARPRRRTANQQSDETVAALPAAVAAPTSRAPRR